MPIQLSASIIVMLAMVIEGITGFGATICALPFMTMIMDVRLAVPFLCMYSLLFGIYVVCRNWKQIDKKTAGNVLLFVGIGMPVGMALFNRLPERVLKLALGVFVTLYAIRTLAGFFVRQTSCPDFPGLDALRKASLMLGGVFHGAFACGGPLIVVYVSAHIKDKLRFRVTISCAWVVFNTVLVIKNIMAGNIYTASFLRLWMNVLPCFLVGAALGNFLHRHVSPRMFVIGTNVLLLAAGVSLLVNQLR